ncbi:nucleotidyltransferase domain-containing protein [Kineococcus glutinatus]|uniref:Polymerase beta nucleotidyltransferase domain-containing protein n=1 Tax=Kineococcus glutinatus TaxID=1070872 RepID=A0ABP9H9U0_9ACTN
MDAANPLRTIAPTVDADVLLVLARTHRPLSGAAVARLASRSYARTRSCLHRLSAHGLLLAEDTGSAVMYRLNRRHVLAGAVLQAASATDSVEQWLVERLARCSPSPRAAVLFGSWARGEAGPDSDIDLLLVRATDVDPESADLDEAWAQQVHVLGEDLEALTGNTVQFVHLDEHQLVQAVAQEQPLIANLRTDGRVLLGPSLRELLHPPTPQAGLGTVAQAAGEGADT